MPRCSVIVVTYNSGAQIEACLRALSTSDCEIVVVDNASQDDTVARVRALEDQMSLQLLTISRNIGFAGGVNQGVRASDSDVLLILNPDAIAEPGAIDAMLDCLATSGASAAGGALIESDGQPAKGFAFRNDSDTDHVTVRSATDKPAVAGKSGESALPLPRSRLFRPAAHRAACRSVHRRNSQSLGFSAGHGRGFLSCLVRRRRFLQAIARSGRSDHFLPGRALSSQRCPQRATTGFLPTSRCSGIRTWCATPASISPLCRCWFCGSRYSTEWYCA